MGPDLERFEDARVRCARAFEGFEGTSLGLWASFEHYEWAEGLSGRPSMCFTEAAERRKCSPVRLEAAFDDSGGSLGRHVGSRQRYARRQGRYGGSYVYLARPLERSVSSLERHARFVRRFIRAQHVYVPAFELHERSIGRYVSSLSRYVYASRR